MGAAAPKPLASHAPLLPLGNVTYVWDNKGLLKEKGAKHPGREIVPF